MHHAFMRTISLGFIFSCFSWREASSFFLHNHFPLSSRSSKPSSSSSFDSLLLLSVSPLSTWSVTDDWNELSHENPRNGIQSQDVFNQVLAEKAAREMQPDDKIMKKESQDSWLKTTVDSIYDNEETGADKVVNKSDREKEEAEVQLSVNEDFMGEEISLLIRCNEDPTQLLIQSGRALPPLTQNERNHISQLLDENLQPTLFLEQAVEKMFTNYAVTVGGASSAIPDSGGEVEETKTTIKNNEETAMSRVEVAKWLSACMKQPVGPYDGRVQAILSKYALYGTAALTQEGMLQLYVSALVGTENAIKRRDKETKSLAKAINLNKLQQLRSKEIQEVWRDIRNHGMFGPVEAERQKMIEQLGREQGMHSSKSNAKGGGAMDAFMDECEIIDDFGSTAVSIATTSKSSRRRVGGPKSSHELVELADDGKTSLYIQDGDFVFIDEESCIGCTQCVLAAPGSFHMTESDGRARTFCQRKSPDVAAAVLSCPVSCMHYVSFQELKELELARDHGDGRKDHRHFGHSDDRGYFIPLTPLHVSGRASDSNHKSSWYHYLRNQCYKSKQCPQKGCFDCPMFQSNPTSNPYFQKRRREDNHIRAKHFIDHGIADSFRKIADL